GHGELAMSQAVILPEMVADEASGTDARRRMGRLPWGALGLVVLVVVYAALLWRGHATGISQPDDNGYFAQGSLLARTGRTWFATESDAQYVGVHWLLTPAGTFVSRYPPGLAVVVAVVYALGGYAAATLVN